MSNFKKSYILIAIFALSGFAMQVNVHKKVSI